LVGAAHLASASVKVKSAVVGDVFDFGPVNVHGIFRDTRVGNGGALAMRSNMADRQ
jgi:hypothetical protein